MAIFPQLKCDETVQLGDQVRFDVSKTVIAKPDTEASVDKIEVAPDGYNFVEIKSIGTSVYKKDWYLDWVYNSKTVDLVDDQEDVSATNFLSISDTITYIAQSYTADFSKDIVEFQTHAKIGSGTPTGNLVVDIVDGLPSAPGAVLGTSESVSFADLPADNFTLSSFVFSTPVPVVQNSEYHFVIRILSTDSGGFIFFHYPDADTYAGGQRWSSSNSGVTWLPQLHDLSFKVISQVLATDGVVNPVVRFTATDGRLISKSLPVTLVTETEDALFTDDNDLITEEHDILNWLPEGRSSFTYIHRRAKERILSWIEEQGYRDCYGNKYTFEDILDREEFKEWSRFLALRLIFGFIYNARGDVYLDKYNEYSKKEATSRNRMFKFDYNGDGLDSGSLDQIRIDTSILKRG